MKTEEAIALTNEVFASIKQANSIEELVKIKTEYPALSKNMMNIDDYPKIEFSISASEIKTLETSGILDANNNLSKNITSTLTDPLAKLLF